MDESTCTAKEVQELYGEVDHLVYEVCNLRKERPFEILKVIKEANKKKAERIVAENIKVIPPKDSLIDSKQVTGCALRKLSDAENRNAQLVKAEAESKQLQSTLQEQREILNALHHLLNSDYAPLDCPRIPKV